MPHPQETAPALPPELAAGRSHDPFASLGWHRGAAGWTFRTLQPFAETVSAEAAGGWKPLGRLPDTPLFEVRAAGAPPKHTRLRVSAGGATHELIDPYSFPPAIGAEDLWLFNSGAARQAWRALGAHAIEVDGWRERASRSGRRTRCSATEPHVQRNLPCRFCSLIGMAP